MIRITEQVSRSQVYLTHQHSSEEGTTPGIYKSSAEQAVAAKAAAGHES
jgi:hypothetical protein